MGSLYAQDCVHPSIPWHCGTCQIPNKRVLPPQRALKSCHFIAPSQNNQHFLLQRFWGSFCYEDREEQGRRQLDEKISAKYGM